MAVVGYAVPTGLPNSSTNPAPVGPRRGRVVKGSQAVSGGTWTVANRGVHASGQGHRCGRCSFTRRAERAIQDGTWTRCARTAAVVALARKAEARAPVARTQVVGHRPQSQPGGVGLEVPRGQVGQGKGLAVGDDLLDNGVVAVPSLGLQGRGRVVGEEGVVAPNRKQLVLLTDGGGCGQGTDAAHDKAVV